MLAVLFNADVGILNCLTVLLSGNFNQSYGLSHKFANQQNCTLCIIIISLKAVGVDHLYYVLRRLLLVYIMVYPLGGWLMCFSLKFQFLPYVV